MKNFEEILVSLIEEAANEVKSDLQISFTPPVYLEVPKQSSHGDFSCSVALQLTKGTGIPPREAASKILEKVRQKIEKQALGALVKELKIEGPGFINIFLANEYHYKILQAIESEKENFGRSHFGKGKKVNIEFVSANPTGPLSVAHARQAAVGDALANIMDFAGYKVTREYYLNDEGNQINMLGASIKARYLELLGKKSEFPEDGYKGRYIYDIAKQVLEEKGDKLGQDDSPEPFRTIGVELILNEIKKELNDFGVKFDVWTSQAAITREKKIEKALGIIKKKGLLYESEGATWFKTTDFGDDKDRVVIKSDGSYTYITPDIAYHMDKFKRGFQMLINMWGPDHHGYIARITAAVVALGHDKESIAVLIIQHATLFRGKEKIPMSTRAGEFITLPQLLEEIGKDASRFFLVSRKLDSHLDFDLELAKKQSNENPVYYVQYAHARICSILQFEKASRRQVRLRRKKGLLRQKDKINFALLKEPKELELIKLLGYFPTVVTTCAKVLEPASMTIYLRDLATAFHSFYTFHKVVSEDAELSSARLALVECTKIVLANGLKLLGLSCPEKM